MHKTVCSVEMILSLIKFAQIFNGHWHVEINHAVARGNPRQFTLKGKYGLQKKTLRRQGTVAQTEALKKDHEMGNSSSKPLSILHPNYDHEKGLHH